MKRTLSFLLPLITPALVAAESLNAAHGFGASLLWIALILIAAKLASLITRIGQPAVLGELLIGVVLGNLFLGGIGFFEPIKADPTIAFLAELGVIILLFQVGLESDPNELKKVGKRSSLVAIAGVALPFAAGYYLGPLLISGLSQNGALFLGATLTATSVGITARVFRDLNTTDTPEARIVLGAAVIDDILGLVILAVVTALVTTGHVSALTTSWIILKALLFLAGSVLIGNAIAKELGQFLSRIHTGIGMKLTLALSFCFGLAYLAQLIGLAPIIGAFAAGIILDPVHFKPFQKPEIVDELKRSTKSKKVKRLLAEHTQSHVEDLIAPISFFLVPIFFVLTGMQVNLVTLTTPSVLLVALALTAIAIAGKLLAGTVAGNVRRWIVGWGMVPRGEVGLIFAAIGRTLGVISDGVFSIIVVVVILTTFATPPMLSYLLRKNS